MVNIAERPAGADAAGAIWSSDGGRRRQAEGARPRDQAAIVHGLYAATDDDERITNDLTAAASTTARNSLTHGLLASVGTRENVTTHYDTLFEAALATPGRECAVLPYEQAQAGGTWLLKLHRSVDHPEDLVLTRDDYLRLPSRSGALFGLLQAMLMTKHILFVGYSLTDDSFHRVMHEVRQVFWSGRIGTVGTALVLFEDPLLERLWGREFHIVPMVGHPAPAKPAAADFVEPVRRLELLLDDVALAAADVSAFLLDETFDDMLSDEERAVRDALLTARDLAAGGRSPIHRQVSDALAAFDVHDPDV